MKQKNETAFEGNELTQRARTYLIGPLAAILFATTLLIGCSRQHEPGEVSGMDTDKDFGAIVPANTGLSSQTIEELKAARAATAKYRNINNAIGDGYQDISVVVAHMGYHYMKSTLLDAQFDPSKPEILVYNKKENGKQELVAVEYAVPINLTPNAAPQGFTGSDDVWKYDTGFGLWLLHAWVWEYNPAGIFNPTNPRVHLH